jgi:phenylpyruvate tautomerase PptA (4-oxalocrotonate tautomerase family)
LIIAQTSSPWGAFAVNVSGAELQARHSHKQAKAGSGFLYFGDRERPTRSDWGVKLTTGATVSFNGTAARLGGIKERPMPKIIIHCAHGVFDPAAKRQVTGALTELALDCEKLPPSPFVKSTVWTYFNEYAADGIFMGGSPAYLKCVSMQIYTIDGGLDAPGKLRLIEGATQILSPYCLVPGGVVPVYIVVHEIPEINWGIFGRNGDLAGLRESGAETPAL